MKSKYLVPPADDHVRPTQKAQPLRKQSKLQKQRQEEWEQELSATLLQFEHGQILELSFKQAVQLLEIAFNPKIIDQNRLTPKQEFENAFELYELIKGQPALLKK